MSKAEKKEVVVEEKVDDKDPRVIEVRAEFDFIQSQAEALEAAGIDKKVVYQGLKELRDTVTVQRKHHPKIEHVYKEMQETNPRRIIAQILQAGALGSPYPEHEIQKLLDFLTYVPRFVKNFPDMYLSQKVSWEKFRHECMLQFATEHSKKTPDPIFGVPHDEVRYRQMYEKYVKEWGKAEESENPYYKDWVKDYFGRNGF